VGVGRRDAADDCEPADRPHGLGRMRHRRIPRAGRGRQRREDAEGHLPKSLPLDVAQQKAAQEEFLGKRNDDHEAEAPGRTKGPGRRAVAELGKRVIS